MLLALVLSAACARKSSVPGVVVGADATWHERAAAAEIRRYLYVRTGVLPVLREVRTFSRVPDGAIAVVERSGPFARGLGEDGLAAKVGALGAEEYWLKTVPRRSGRIVLVAGGSGPAVLYGAYRLAETLGVRFSLEGDVVPDGRIGPPAIDLDETGRPLFAVRGIQPFHDFPEGPDWWTRENYKAVLSQLPKLRMNFFGLHTYPENPSREHGATPNAEPTVWIGRAEDAGPDGKVKAAYPASYQNTARGNWGYESKKTADFHFGARLLFERDDFGNEVMEGFAPDPADTRGRRTRSSTGPPPSSRTPSPWPAASGSRPASARKRRSPFPTSSGSGWPPPAAIPRTRPWSRTSTRRCSGASPPPTPSTTTGSGRPEGWTWDDASPEAIKAVTTDLDMGVEAWREVSPPFRLATCGWVLGPPLEPHPLRPGPAQGRGHEHASTARSARRRSTRASPASRAGPSGPSPGWRTIPR
ncbi:MAG: hypothetical protein MZV64_12575 [Ignavibacteriales bacterium]|nr:hypothetical protein [Ignavibacteriales bacterium]